MIQDDIIKANCASALEQVKQDERNEDRKAELRAEEFLNSRRPRHYTFIGKHDDKYEALQDIYRDNVETSREQIN